MADQKGADIIVLPYDWTYATWTSAEFYPDTVNRAIELAGIARATGKPLVVFYETDVKQDIPFDHYLFCTDLERSTRKPLEFALPGWSEDLLRKYRGGEVPLKRKSSRATVGFCGYAPPLGMAFGRARTKETIRYFLSRTGIMRRLPARANASPRMRLARTAGPSVRVRALRALARSDHVDVNFLIRPQPTHPKGGRWKQPRDGVSVAANLQRDLLDNTLQSDYVLCCRGFGNFSYRLYETMAAGRIPVLVDTDCVLPFDFLLDWRNYCVLIPERDLPEIAARVAEFHDTLSEGEFQELQVECRRLWERWLSPEGFFRNLHRHFQFEASVADTDL